MSSDIPKEDLPGSASANSDPVECLRDADPAVGSPDPDVAAIREHTLRASRVTVFPLWQRSRPLAFAVAASVVAAAAVAGVAVGRVSAPSNDPIAASEAPNAPDVAVETPELPVEGQRPAGNSSGPNGSASAAVAPGASTMGAEAAMADRSMMAYPGGFISLVPGPDLGNETSSAAGYRLDGSLVDRKALAASLADAFGLKGKVVEFEYGWQVGSSDGSGPQVMVSNDAGVTWSFSNPEASPPPCAAPREPMPYPALGDQSPPSDSVSSKSQEEAAPELGLSGSGDAGVLPPFTAEECTPPGKQMGAATALAKAKGLVAGLVSPGTMPGASMEWSSGTAEGGSWANAWQTVDGQQTQLSWSFSFYGEDITWANGLAAELKKVDAYPIVGPYEAVARLSESKFSGFGPIPVYEESATPMPIDVGIAGTSDVAAPSSPPPGTAGRVQAWWDPVTAVKAELSLAQYWQPDGTMLLLPAYQVETADDRGTWSVIAVDESAIDFLTPPRY